MTNLSRFCRLVCVACNGPNHRLPEDERLGNTGSTNPLIQAVRKAVFRIEKDAGQAVAWNASGSEIGTVGGARDHPRNDGGTRISLSQRSLNSTHDLIVEGRGVAGHRHAVHGPLELGVTCHQTQFSHNVLDTVSWEDAAIDRGRSGSR